MIQILRVEPGVMIGQISRYLCKRGWTIPQVPELETLSVGGLICGGGVESSAHKLGVFFETALSYEVLLPNGDISNCSKVRQLLKKKIYKNIK